MSMSSDSDPHGSPPDTEVDTPVLIAGGGPVGLMMALELDYRGVDAILIERNPTTTRHPKMDITNGRTMEMFRRLGVIDVLRRGAVPPTHPMSVVWADSIDGPELARFDYPSVDAVRETLRDLNDGSTASEPSMRISQVHLEPILKRYIEEHCAHIDVRFGWGIETFEQNADAVTSTIRTTDTGETAKIRSAYLAGCDGAGSITRRTLGIAINTIVSADYEKTGGDRTNYLDDARGEPPGGRDDRPTVMMIHFTSPERELFQRFGLTWHLQTPSGINIIAQNDLDTWTVHARASMIDDLDADPKEILFGLLGCEFECEILQANTWNPSLGLADSYGSGRVWLAGDAVHQVIPTGGYGMNSGMGDALGLSWALAANVHGWGGPQLFEAYEVERRHVGARVRLASARHSNIRQRIGKAYSPLIREASDEGREALAAYGQLIADLGNLENEAWGVEWGYRYDGSPVICHEGGEPPPYEWDAFVPSAWPGVRAPHVFLASGESIHDLFGPGFTLLSFGDESCATFVDAARSAGVPVEVVQVNDQHAAAIYQQPLVLVRPDQHVAWSGATEPSRDRVEDIINRVRGATTLV